MATKLSVSVRYGSHMPALLQAVLKTRGAVLELGVGVFSTHTLHHLCAIRGRELVTVENFDFWYQWGLQYQTALHLIVKIDKWPEAPIERDWDVALVDHSPDERRGVELERLANHARYVIAHDANRRYWRQYGYERAFDLYKYRLVFDKANPATMILSNFESLDTFWEAA